MKQIFTVTLPDIGEGVVEGEVVEWLKQVGDPLAQDEPVVVVMTDKATVELPAPHPGKLSKQHCAAGQVAIKDRPLYDIELEKPVTTVKEKESPKIVPVRKQERSAVSSDGKALAAPPVRRLAREMGIDLDRVTGTGKEGRITAQDLKQVSAHSEVERLEDDLEVPLVGVRGMMAKKMAEAKRLVPHFSFFEKVNVERLLKLHDNVKKEGEREGIRVTFMPYFIRALSLTINEFPELNSSLDQSTLLLHRHHNIGIAMSTEQGLTVPVLKDVQLLSFPDVIRSYEKLKQRAADKKLTPSDMKGGTVTISNFGVFGNGGVWATPIINPPESAILAVNRIQKQPVVKHDKLVVGDVLDLSWSFDHRVIDGNLASAISHHFAKLIENPAFLL
jgi:pyruvate dehydrogenase E2 component (dihydrolipoamide acetyltransferase)